VDGLGFEDKKVGLVFDSIGECKADWPGGGDADLDGEDIVIPRRSLVAQVTFQHGKNRVLPLPFKERSAQAAEEFAAGGFEDFEVAGVIDVVADGAISVGNAVGCEKGMAWGAVISIQ